MIARIGISIVSTNVKTPITAMNRLKLSFDTDRRPPLNPRP